MSRIAHAFDKAQREERAAFIPYLTAGFPNREGFVTQARAMLELADVLEVGLPYSDPLGDGPTIQRSSEAALKGGIRTKDAFELIAKLRASSDKAIALMTYYNPIYCYQGGEQAFLKDLKAAGADGVILPDLPPDEGETLIATARELELDTIFLVAPTSTDARIKLVTEACRGFVYAVSVTGVTGARDTLPPEVSELVARVKAATEVPVAVGFGVKNADTARTIASAADGVVVGSALITAIAENRDALALAREIVGACRKTSLKPG